MEASGTRKRALARNPSKVEERFDASGSDVENAAPPAIALRGAQGRRLPGRPRHGSIPDILAKRHLPKGPSSVSELCRYPYPIMDTIFADPERRQRLYDLLGPGLCETVDYAGMHCEGEAKRLMFQAILDSHKWAPEFYKVSRCCDNASLPQRVLIQISEQIFHGEMCVLTDMHDYIGPAGNKLLDQLELEPNASAKARSEAYASMHDWIVDNVKSLYTPGRTCRCLMHDEQCPVAGRVADELLKTRREELEHGLRQPPLMVNSAGTVCKDWSTVGHRAGVGGMTERTHATWLGERIGCHLVGTDNLFFAECTKLYNAQEKLLVPLKRTHKVVFVNTGPEVLGHPSRRPCSLAAGLSLKTLIWVGPDDPAQVQDHFNSLFARSTELTGSVYFNASPAALCLFAKQAMKMRRGVRLDDHVFQRMETYGRDFLELFFPPGGLQRQEKYLEKQAELQGLDGTCIVDTEQWPSSKAAVAGPMFPTQLTHGTLVNCDGFHLALGTDHLAANGFSVYPDFGGEGARSSKMASILLGMSDAEQKELSWNGQNLPSTLAWFMYVFSHAVRRPTIRVCAEPSALSRGTSRYLDGFGSEASDEEEGEGEVEQ